MPTEQNFEYSVYVVELGKRMGKLPSVQLRNPQRVLSKPCVYIGLIKGRIGPRFDYRRATGEFEWRVYHHGVRIIPELYEDLNPMTYETALQEAKRLADDLRAKGYGVVNSISEGSQSYRSVSRKQTSNGRSLRGLKQGDYVVRSENNLELFG